MARAALLAATYGPQQGGPPVAASRAVREAPGQHQLLQG